MSKQSDKEKVLAVYPSARCEKVVAGFRVGTEWIWYSNICSSEPLAWSNAAQRLEEK